MDDTHTAILEVAKRLGALQFGEFTLSSGAKGTYYFDGRLLTLDPEGAILIARAFMPVLIDCGAEAIAAMEIVDFVAINNSQTSEIVIDSLKPDVYVKGVEYADTGNDVTGKISLEMPI